MTNAFHQRSYIAAVDAERLASCELDVLVRAAAGGDESAWTALVGRFSRRLRSLARSYRLRGDDVEDVVQTTFMRLYLKIDTLREPSALPGWLDTTLRRESLRRIGEGAREALVDDGAVFDVVEEADEPLPAELGSSLRAAVRRLPDRQRELMVLMSVDPQPSYEQIARTLGIPIGSIGPTRARALARLRAEGALSAVYSECRS